MTFLKVLVAHVLRKFTLSTDLCYKDIKFKTLLMVEVVGGYNIRLQERN